MPKVKLTKDKEEELRAKMLKFRAEGEEGNKNAFIRMTQNERFKIGFHWDHDDKSFNEAHGKFSLTINEVLPIILDITGTQEENPLDYKVRNVKGGTQVTAEILTALAKNVMDKSMGREEASRCFEAGNTTNRGFLQLIKDYENDPLNGDLKIIETDPFMVLPDPTCKVYDYNQPGNGAKYIWVDSWEDKEKMEAKYPGKELKSANFDPISRGMLGRFAGVMGLMFGGGGPDLHLRDDYRHHDEHTFKEEMESNTTKKTHNYRVSTCWWKEWKKGIYLQKLDDPLNYLALTKPKDISDAKKLAAQDPNLRVIDKDNEENQLTVAVLMKTVMIGDIILEHHEDPFDGMNLYPIVRFAPYFDHGYEFSPISNLIGPQKLINYTFSSLVNILKNLANSGYFTGKSTQRAIEWLQEHGGEDGIVIDKTKFSGIVEKIKTTDYPTGFDIITQRGKENMREISQTQLVVPQRGGVESGKAKQIDEIRQQRTKGIIFRNWNQTNILIARVLIELIQNTNIFSDDEIMAIVDEEDLLDQKILDQAKGIIINQLQQQGATIPEQPQSPNPIRMSNTPAINQAEMLDKFQEEMALFKQFVEQVEQAAVPIAKEITLKLLRQMQQGRYGVKVDTSPMAPTVRLMRRLESLELDKQLIEGGRQGISRKKLIELSDVQDKEEIIAEEVPMQGAA